MLEVWKGRSDGKGSERIHEVVQCLDREAALPPSAFALIGFCCDEGVRRNSGRVGAREGPAAWRQSLAGLPVPTNRSIIDLGDIVCDGDSLESAQSELGDLVSGVLSRGGIPIVCGGGHEVAWGQFLGISRAKLDASLSILNLDAHYDLRPLIEGRGNSGTSFAQIADHQQKNKHPFNYACVGLQPLSNTQGLHEKAKKLDVLTIAAEEIENASDTLKRFIEQSKHLFLSICLDVFAAPFAPGVSAPQPFGLLPVQALPVIRQAASSGRLIGCCIAELSPRYDVDGATAKLAAYLTAEVMKSASL